MLKQKVIDLLGSAAKKPNTSTNFVFYESYRKDKKIRKISSTKIRKRPIYRFFLDFDDLYFPLHCMLDLESTSFVISPEAAKAFRIPVVKRTKTVKSADVTGREIETEELFTISLGLSFGSHRSYDEKDHAFEVMKTSQDYDCSIPAWYLEKHKARETTTSHLHFPHYSGECYGHGKIHPEYSITYDK